MCLKKSSVLKNVRKNNFRQEEENFSIVCFCNKKRKSNIIVSLRGPGTQTKYKPNSVTDNSMHQITEAMFNFYIDNAMN